MNQNTKRLITALLAFLMRSLEIFFKGIYIVAIALGKILYPIFRLIIKTIFLPIYGKYIVAKNKLSKKTKNLIDKILFSIANKYTVYLILLVITISVLVGNVSPASNKEDYGQNALIYSIIGVKSIELFEDNYKTADESKVYSYFGENAVLRRNLFTQSQREDEELFNKEIFSLAMNVEGSAISKPDLIDTEEAKIGSKSIREYIVAEGDSIGRIASKFNISIDTILWANNLAATSYIKPNQKLVIPPVSGVLHTVAKGDTLTKIASKYAGSVDIINSFNNIEEKGLIAGEKIMVPGGRIIYTAKPRATVASLPTQSYKPSSNIVSTGKMLWPSACQRISQYYRGWLHTGIDIACPSGSALKAADGGVVTRVQYLKTGYGYNVIINHGGGKQTLYGHMSRIDVVAGQRVEKGEVIGLEGSTGRSTGPHLHFEVIINGSKVNPLSYIR